MARRTIWEYQVGDMLTPYAASGISRKDALIRWGIETDMKRCVCIWRRPIRTGAAQWELFKKGKEPDGEYLSPDRFDVQEESVLVNGVDIDSAGSVTLHAEMNATVITDDGRTFSGSGDVQLSAQ